jgi:hypothetical protein
MDRPDPQALRAFLNKVIAFSDAMDAAEPHAVLQTDPATESRTVIGPFANRATALAAIDLLTEQWARVHEPPMAVFDVIQFESPDPAVLAAVTDRPGEEA